MYSTITGAQSHSGKILSVSVKIVSTRPHQCQRSEAFERDRGEEGHRIFSRTIFHGGPISSSRVAYLAPCVHVFKQESFKTEVAVDSSTAFCVYGFRSLLKSEMKIGEVYRFHWTFRLLPIGSLMEQSAYIRDQLILPITYVYVYS